MFEEYKNKKIGILGYGIEGKATFEYLKSKGFPSSVLDREDEEVFLKKHPELKADKAKLILGEDYLSHLGEFEVIFKTPGQKNTPEIQEAIQKGIKFTSQIEEFFNYCPCPIIGVTGTKGKGTTSTLIAEMLKNSGINVYLGGNIGVPAIEFLDKLKNDSFVVLELSSFQLQFLQKSPHIAVVLMVTSEHLDYHATTDEYRDAKKSIVRYQNEDDFAVINQDYEASKSFSSETLAKVYFVSKKEPTNGCYVDNDDNVVLKVTSGEKKLINFKDLLLRGRHNLENVSAASMAATLAGVAPKVITETLSTFKGLEHRLELVREVNGVSYYNDSFSTVPETSIAAISSFDQPIILIAGGSYKGSNYKELGEKIADSNVKSIILIGEMAEEIRNSIPKDFKGELILGLTDMIEIVNKAEELSEPGDVVLLSPACASFGLFENYKDRGNQFKKAVDKL